MIKRLVLAGLLACGVSFGAAAQKLEPQDFEVRSTNDMVDLCTVAATNELYREAIHFCHGYLTGAYAYHVRLMSGPNAQNMFCMPNPPPSRTDAINKYVIWVKSNPKYKGDPVPDTMLRFLIASYPC